MSPSFEEPDPGARKCKIECSGYGEVKLAFWLVGFSWYMTVRKTNRMSYCDRTSNRHTEHALSASAVLSLYRKTCARVFPLGSLMTVHLRYVLIG